MTLSSAEESLAKANATAGNNSHERIAESPRRTTSKRPITANVILCDAGSGGPHKRAATNRTARSCSDRPAILIRLNSYFRIKLHQPHESPSHPSELWTAGAQNRSCVWVLCVDACARASAHPPSTTGMNGQRLKTKLAYALSQPATCRNFTYNPTTHVHVHQPRVHALRRANANTCVHHRDMRGCTSRETFVSFHPFPPPSAMVEATVDISFLARAKYRAFIPVVRSSARRRRGNASRSPIKSENCDIMRGLSKDQDVC